MRPLRACVLSFALHRAAQIFGLLPLHFALTGNASDAALVSALLVAHQGAVKEKTKVHPPRLCTASVHTRSHSLATRCPGWEATAALCCGRGGVRGGGWQAAGGSPWRCQEEGPSAPTAHAQPSVGWIAQPYIRKRALTFSPPCCAVWDAAAALCCGRKGFRGGGQEAAEGSPWRCQDDGQGAHAGHNRLCMQTCSYLLPAACAELEEAAAALCCSSEGIGGSCDGAA